MPSQGPLVLLCHREVAFVGSEIRMQDHAIRNTSPSSRCSTLDTANWWHSHNGMRIYPEPLPLDQLEAISIVQKKASAGQVPALADATEAQELR